MSWLQRSHRTTQALALVLLLSWSLSASASHYRLSNAAELVSPTEAEALKKQGIQTSAELLDAVAKKKDRRALAKRSKLSYKRLGVLAFQCDLLRIQGLGPSAVILLQKAGIKHSAALKRASSARLHKTLIERQKAGEKGEVIPGIDELDNWIGQAKGLRAIVDGAR